MSLTLQMAQQCRQQQNATAGLRAVGSKAFHLVKRMLHMQHCAMHNLPLHPWYAGLCNPVH